MRKNNIIELSAKSVRAQGKACCIPSGRQRQKRKQKRHSICLLPSMMLAYPNMKQKFVEYQQTEKLKQIDKNKVIRLKMR